MSPYAVIAMTVALVTLIGTAVTIGMAWGTLSTNQKTHEERDNERFGEIAGTLKEVRDDIKVILKSH